MNTKIVHIITWILVIIGGLNWLLVGLFDWGVANLVGDAIARVIYILVGLSAVYEIATHKQNCKACVSMGSSSTSSMGGMNR